MSKAATRRCLRCGCLDSRACVKDGIACSWVAEVDVCSHCLTDEEAALYISLLGALNSAQARRDRAEQDVEWEKKRISDFGSLISAASKKKGRKS